MNLLVIEDDRKLNRMLCEILEKEGYTVKACTDGEEGAYYLQQNAFDDNDAHASHQKQVKLLKMVLSYYAAARGS